MEGAPTKILDRPTSSLRIQLSLLNRSSLGTLRFGERGETAVFAGFILLCC